MHGLISNWSLSLIALTTLAACGGASTPPQAPDATATADPVARGQALYGEVCAGCHGADGSGIGSSPALVGDGALARFGSAAEVWDYVLAEMPPADPGTLGEEGTGAVVAFALSANGIDPGEGPFTRERAASITLGE